MMLDGLALATVEVAVLATVVAVLAGLLGFLVGRRPRSSEAAPTQPSDVERATLGTDEIDAAGLRSELEHQAREMGRFEAKAIAAWDRTVPPLEERIAGLVDEVHDLRGRLQRAEDDRAIEARTSEQLREALSARDRLLSEQEH